MVNNLKSLMQKFSDESACRQFLVQQRWNGSPVCPYCGCEKWYSIEDGKRFKCGSKECYKKYSVTVGTVFESSKIPLSTWFPAVYILSSHKKGISSIQLAKDLGVTQKTAWFMIHRIRESLKDKNSVVLSGEVEIDETYMSRKFASEYKGLSPEMVARITEENKNKTSAKKGAVVGMKQREGKVLVFAAPNPGASEIKPLVDKHIAAGTKLYTDESMKYNNILSAFERETVNHSKKQWKNGEASTNGIENFWSVMRRGIYGIYHQVSFKHLQRYCDEFAYRYNSRTIKDGDRFELSLQRIAGRLTYKQLVHGQSI